MRPESFEKFYYTKVGLGEGCGCAERVIDVHEFNRLAGRPMVRRRAPLPGFLATGRKLASAFRDLLPGRRRCLPDDGTV